MEDINQDVILNGLSADDQKDFDGDTMILSKKTGHCTHPGAVKNRRLVRKKRAKKLARRR